MNRRIAIEPALSNVRNHLAGKGYTVENLNSNEMGSYDAIVITGLNNNLLGMSDTDSKAVVIDASGLTPEEVASEIDRSLS